MEKLKQKSGEKAETNLDDLRAKANDAFEKDMDNYEEMVKFVKQLKEKHPDYSECRLYHLLVGSTPKGECRRFDFDGEDSIENFINSL